MFQKSRKQVSEQEALLKLSALCSQSEHSSGEMLEKMRRWSMPMEEAQRVLDRLIDERFVDDERFAGFFVRDKIRFDRWGRRKIEQALYRKGVARDIIGSREFLKYVPFLFTMFVLIANPSASMALSRTASSFRSSRNGRS